MNSTKTSYPYPLQSIQIGTANFSHVDTAIIFLLPNLPLFVFCFCYSHLRFGSVFFIVLFKTVRITIIMFPTHRPPPLPPPPPPLPPSPPPLPQLTSSRPSSETSMNADSPQTPSVSARTAETPLNALPPAPPLPSPPHLTPSPVSRRTASDDSLQSDDGKPTLDTRLKTSTHTSPAVLPCTSTASPTTSRSSTPTCPKSPTSSSKLSPSSSASSACSTSSSRTSTSASYINDIGSPVFHDPHPHRTQTVSRAYAKRVYCSTDEESDASSSDEDDDHGNDDDSCKFATRSNGLDLEKNSSHTPSRASQLNGCKPAVNKDKNQNANGFSHDIHEGWDNDIDDQLSLEELQLDADAITAAIEKAPVGLGPTTDMTSPKRRPRKLSNIPSPRASSSFQAQYRNSERRQNNVNTAMQTECNPSDDTTPLPCRDNARRHQLLGRVKQAANELAKLQVMTASRAADVACDHHRTTEDSRDVQRLRTELRTLLITLDHLTRLTLEQAFIARDALETHR